MTEKLKLDLTLLLPQMEAGDRCIRLLTDALAGLRGVEEAHITRDAGHAALCIHYDPNLVTLAQLERLAVEAGGRITDRYRHETLPFVGLDAADAAPTLAAALERLPGMLHASVSYAAGLIYVAYDSEALERAPIERAARRQGARLLPAPAHHGVPLRGDQFVPPRHSVPVRGEAEERGHEAHDHGSAPPFLPHWMQERWTLLLVALAGLALAAGWLGERFFGLSPTAAWLLYLVAYAAGGYDIATHALPGLLAGRFDTDVLMLAAAAGAALLGEWAEGAFLLFLFSLGHAGEHYALDRARSAVNALGALMPKTARVRRGGPGGAGEIVEIPVEQVQVGDVVVVRPGDRVPVDGVVAEGSSAVDQSAITGESMPVEKEVGDELFAGTVNQSGALHVTVSRLAADNTLSRVMHLVAEAQSGQSPTQQLTQRFTRWFVPTVLVATLLVMALPPLFGWMPFRDSFYRAMLLLVAASPCALAIGTPAAVLAGIAQAARRGVLIKGGVHLENLGRVAAVAFDKTGTLTEGRFRVTDVISLNGAPAGELLAAAAAVEQQSSHPLAQAVVAAAQGRGLSLPAAAEVENVAGKGVRGVVAGRQVEIGSARLFANEDAPGGVADEAAAAAALGLQAAGKSTMFVRRDGAFLGVLGLADTPRPGVADTLAALRGLGVARLAMLTGDHAGAAEAVAGELGLTDVRAGLLPEQKLDAIRALEQEHGPVAMVGDGVNDAPALATATVGIAMGGAGAAVALETADVALMADDLSRLPFAVGLSRAARGIIVQNLVVALGVIALLLVVSVLGWVQLSAAVVLHEGSTIVVVLNALRLLGYRG